jgi:hypothetical protein
MTTDQAGTIRPVRRPIGAPTLEAVTTTPRWLREHRRAVRAAADRRRPAPAADPDAPFKWVDWDNFGMRLPEDEAAAFIAAIEEAKGRPLVG